MALSKEQEQEVHESLGRFGLSSLEQKAYLTLLEGGEMTATPLSKVLNIPLTTTQSILKRLSDQEVVLVTKRKSRSAYLAKDPSVFRKILEQKMREIADAVPIMKSLQADVVGIGSIKVYERERATEIFHHALATEEKLIYEIVSAAELQKVLGERFHFTKRRLEAGIRLKSLRVEEHEIKKYSKKTHEEELREAKFLPREMTFETSVMFWDDNMTAFFMPKSEKLGWTVESKALNTMMRQLFDMLWSVSRKMETKEE